MITRRLPCLCRAAILVTIPPKIAFTGAGPTARVGAVLALAVVPVLYTDRLRAVAATTTLTVEKITVAPL
jgi:hypothetical protein